MNITISENFYDVSKIPKNWTKTRLKYALSFSENKSSNFNDEEILSLTKKGIILKDITNNEGQIAESYEKYTLINKGQICMNPMDLLSGWVDISSFEGLISPAYYTFIINEGCDVNFINYFLQSNYLRRTFFKLGKGVASHDNFGRWVLTPEELKNITIYLPNLKKQKIISEYLDNKSNNIELLIESTKKKIELLKEQRISMIRSYITKGLDSNVEMKYSGLDWIGNIPKHWEIKKITYVTTSIGSGTTPKSDNLDYYQNGTINWLVTGDLNNKEIFETSNKITKKALSDYSTLKVYPKESLMIAMYGGTIGKLGILKIESSVNQATCVLFFNKNQDVKFWFNIFLSHQKYIISLGYGGGQPNISQDVIKNLRFPVPPTLDEQQKIVLKINQKLLKHDDLIQKEFELLDLYKEYRLTLLSSVITGKFQVTEDML
jgi:type I restriction enzyme, S subunit